MAEFIAEMQERLLPEYEQMKNYSVFTADQVREIVSRRERLFLKINKSHQSITDYLDFILYEKHMHMTIVDKEKKMHVKLTGLKASIATRIMRLYREALAKFNHDRRLWSNWIKFSKKSNPVEVAGIYEKMLLYHGDSPDLWVDAALWLYEFNRLNIDRVKDILLRGLQRHPDSEALNKCFFDIMLKEAALANNERNLAENTLSEQDIKLERVEAVYRNSMANITQLDYFVKLLESCEDHAGGLWELLAQRELRGLSSGRPEEEDLDSSDEEPASQEIALRKCPLSQATHSTLRDCIQIGGGGAANDRNVEYVFGCHAGPQ
ncbi:GM13683 [Drosophila sechellia]|uniref:GM13683 n=1 Tax=Drosophila sechellia TaxID=7238 RepID=B4IJQ0_DROSE|nr:GM13683 [Drosophila sechellia]